MRLLRTACLALVAVVAESQTLRKFSRHGCNGAVAVCSVRNDVHRDQYWPQMTCCERGVKKSGSLTISGVQGSVGEISLVYKGNFNTQCSVQNDRYIGGTSGCIQGRSLGTGVWLTCAMQYANVVYQQNCSYNRKKRGIGNSTVDGLGHEDMDLPLAPGNGTEPPEGEDLLENRPYDPDWLPSGFYDALYNPISEEEYWRQVEWEEEHDVPYAIAMQWEQEHGTPYTAATEENSSLEERQAGGLSILTYASDQCRGERLRHVTQENVCYTSTNGVSLDVEGLPSNCNVVTWTDEQCQEDPFTNVQSIRGSPATGCYSGDNFGSIAVTCG